jgi:hypothetical protein
MVGLRAYMYAMDRAVINVSDVHLSSISWLLEIEFIR